MGHGHDHAEDRTTYYIEQLCTIGVCGAFGGIAVMMYKRDILKLFLDPKFHPFVLWAGIALLVMVVVRAVAVWRSAGQTGHSHEHAHDHEHGADCPDHGHACSHDHSHDHNHPHTHEHAHDHQHDQAHEHGHDHGWNPWRYAVLLLPIVLYFLNLPNQGFSSDWFKSRALNPDQIQSANVHYCSELGIQLKDQSTGALPQVEKVADDSPAAGAGIQPGDVLAKIDSAPIQGMSLDAVLNKLQGPEKSKVKLTVEREGATRDVELERKDVEAVLLGFKELEQAALVEKQREFWTGRAGKMRGQFSPSKRDKGFTLMRLKMTCCAADVTPAQVWIESPESVEKFKAAEWVEVEGQIRFDQAPGKFIPVLKVTAMEKIRRIPPEADLYLR